MITTGMTRIEESTMVAIQENTRVQREILAQITRIANVLETNNRKIDIDDACAWWAEYLDYPTNDQEDRDRINEMVTEFRNAMK